MIPKTNSRRLAPKPGRWRSRPYREWLVEQGCIVPGCNCRDVQAHHLLHSEEAKARGLKPGDQWCVGLCLWHHDDLHRGGEKESDWCRRHGFDGIAQARALFAEWRKTQSDATGT